ncbi:MAG TPA: hypothetical protein VGM17_00960 [Rhizomicrobium sp.]
MFEDVPPFLNWAVSTLIRKEHRNRDFKYAAAATMVIAYYLDKNTVGMTRKGMEFFRFRPTDIGVSFHFFVKTVQVGETIFLLRNCDGFSELCQKLQQGDLDAQFLELMAARTFFNAGFAIVAHAQTMVKRQDYDFSALRGTEVFNVEVTRIGVRDFSSKTVMNRLCKKHSQLPDTAPAIIFCGYPEAWQKEVPFLEMQLRHVALDFFRNKRRINAVVFTHEEWRPYSEDNRHGALAIVDFSVFNKRAKHPFSNWYFLHNIGYKYDSDWRDPEKAKILRRSEFYRWVDTLAPADGSAQ